MVERDKYGRDLRLQKGDIVEVERVGQVVTKEVAVFGGWLLRDGYAFDYQALIVVEDGPTYKGIHPSCVTLLTRPEK